MIKGYVESAGEDNFSIYAAEDIPIWGYGSNQQEAEADFKQCYYDQAEEIASNSNGEYPIWFDKDTEFLFESPK